MSTVIVEQPMPIYKAIAYLNQLLEAQKERGSEEEVIIITHVP